MIDCAEMQDALKERCAYLVFIASFFWLHQLVTKHINRRTNPRLIKQKYRRDLVDVSKTGISNNDVVNEAIDNIVAQSSGSGSGTALASTAIPRLLQKRRERESSGEDDKREVRTEH